MIQEVKNNPNALTIDSFSQICLVYGKFLGQTTLRNEFIHFCQIYDTFEKTLRLPTNLHFDSIIDESEDNIIESDNDKDENLENLNQSLNFPNRKYINSTNLKSIKTIFKVFQHGQLACDFATLNTSLMISLTLPVMITSTERTFSKLRFN